MSDEEVELSGGGSDAIYHGAAGEEIEFRSAPPEFDPKAASDEELDRYGYPPRPSIAEPEAREVWEETVGESTDSAAPGGCMGASEPEFAPVSGSGPTIRYSEAFAGWITEDVNGPANQWRGAVAKYHVPKLRKTCPPQNSALVSWVGLGGSTINSPFFQAGTNEPFGIGKSEIAAFTEFFRGGSELGTKASEQPNFHDLNLKAGDPVFAVALWKPGPEKALMYVQNLRNGEKISAEPHGKESVFYDGRKLQFVTAERPILGRSERYEQQDFGTLGFSGAAGFVSGKGVKSIGALDHRVRLEMQKTKNNQLTGNLMVSTSSISSSGFGFRSFWHHCHP